MAKPPPGAFQGFHRFKLGKTPARRGAVKFKLSAYLVKHKLPTPPKMFGHQGLIGSKKWGLFANDLYHDCVWAGAAHETMLWNKEAHRPVKFTDKNVLKAYAAVTGFSPKDPTTDRGTDIQHAASYRRKTGVLDARGKRHKIHAYLALKPGDVDLLAIAMYLFSAVGIGLRLPERAMKQFAAGKPWDVVPGRHRTGGHYVSGVGRDIKGNFVVVTWGRLQVMTPRFYKKYCDEAIAYISEEMLVPPRDTTLEGLDLAQLAADLKGLK